MQTTAQFKIYLESRGFSLRADGNALYVEPRANLTPDDVGRIKREKADLIALLTAPLVRAVSVGKLPFFNENGDLVISAETDSQFWYWMPEGQTIWQTLADLNANAEAVRRYAGRSDAPLHTAMGVRDCTGEVVELDGLSLCVSCGWFTEATNDKHAELVRELGF